MKVICISNIIDGDLVDLEIGKVYEMVDDHPKFIFNKVYQLKNEDTQVVVYYSISLFKRLDEFRDDKLNELGI